MHLYSQGHSKNNALKLELHKLSNIFILLFAIIFIIISSQSLHIGSAGGVEQWLNLLPGFFYGDQDFLFSYGPLFWLTGNTVVQYSQYSYWISVLFISAYSAIMWSLLVKISFQYNIVILLAVVYAFFLKSFNVTPVFFTFPLFYIVYFRSIDDERWLDKKSVLVLLALLTAFLFYVRFFYGLVSLLTFASYIFSTRFLRRKYLPVFVFSISSVVFYFVVGFFVFHNIESIVNYTNINMQLSFGNSVDMSYDVKIKNATWIIIALVVMLFNLYMLKQYPELLLTVNGLTLIFLKLGFSRADHYISYFIGPLSLMALICSVSVVRKWRFVSISIMALLFILGSISIYPNARTLAWFKTHEDFSKSVADRAAETYPQFKLPEEIVNLVGNKTIDVYPYQNEYILSNKLNYLHRPSFQSYMTLTPVLDKINAVFLSGNKGPEYILWTGGIECSSLDCAAFDDFDEKYSLNEDPLTTMAILKNYQVVKTSSDANNKPFMLLQKKHNPVNDMPQDLGAITMHFGEWVSVPNSSQGIVKLRPDFKFTLLAKFQNMLYRGGVLYVNYKLHSGYVKRYRLNIINAQSGVWVSPLLNEFPLKGERVVEVMIETPSKHYFKKEFKAVWQKYDVENVLIHETRYPEFTSTKPNVLHEEISSCEANIDNLDIFKFQIDGKLKTTLRISGWTAFSIERNQPSDHAWLTLSNDSGQYFYLPLEPQSRPDVANYFKKTSLSNSGYKVISNTSDFKGNYRVGLAIEGNGILRRCNNFARPIVLP